MMNDVIAQSPHHLANFESNLGLEREDVTQLFEQEIVIFLKDR